jgi:hypothetical protein
LESKTNWNEKVLSHFISTWLIDWLIDCVLRHFQQYFSYIMAASFSGGRSRSIRREPPTMDKQLVNFITCGCESSTSFFVFYKAGRLITCVLTKPWLRIINEM